MSAARGGAAPLAAGLVVAAYTAALRRYGVFDPVDEGLLLVQALRTAHGQVPYVDFHTGYGPLYFRLQAWLLEAGGWDAIRWGLVAVHGAAGALLFVLARRLAGPALAWVAVALEVAFFLPVAPGRGAPFNVPYPAWYAGLAGVGLAVLLGGVAPVRSWRLGAAGVIAAAVAAMKPSSGLLLAAGATAAVVLGEVRAGGGGMVARAVLGLVALAAAALVAPSGLTVAACVLAPPVVALAALGARRGVADGDALRRLGALAAGFVPPVAVAFAPSLATVGPLGLAREIGAGVARLYALPLPWPAGVAGAVGLAAFAARGRGAGALVVAAAAAAAVAFVGGAAGAEAPLAALRLGAEQGLLALVPLALWGALAALRAGGEAALVPPTAIAAAAALQLYPRPDLIHVMPLGPLLLPLALRLWRTAARQLPLVPPAALVALPLAVALGRFLPTALVLGHVATGRVAEVALGGMRLVVEPEGKAPLGAIAAAADAVRDIPPDETVLAFPACGMVPFVAGRLPAGPHDYFYPGRPDRAEAALLAARLAARPPRLAVTCGAAGTALAGAWNDYPELLALLATRYRERLAGAAFAVRERRE